MSNTYDMGVPIIFAKYLLDACCLDQTGHLPQPPASGVFLMCPCNNAPAGPTLQASLPPSLTYTPPSPAEVKAVQTHWDNACQCSLHTDCNLGNVNIWPEARCTLKQSWSLKTNRWVSGNVVDAIVALLNTRQTGLCLHKHDPVFFLNSCFYSLLQG